MRNYEMTALLRDSASEIEEGKSAIKEILSKNSAEVTAEEDWGQKRLWHKVGHEEYAFFAYLKFNAEPSSIAKIEHECKINQKILRVMIARV
ncbi:MAG: 30S ribosomal protein S6 [Leptospiraceae bacterium]|nr:30S ribosomal protein S6 [Leptospiraceae bacterium]MCP5503440.1 30S ribosomal protein S6 [Leptospiraceae bacterium]